MQLLAYIVFPVFLFAIILLFKKNTYLSLFQFLSYVFILTVVLQFIVNKVNPGFTLVAGRSIHIIILLYIGYKFLANPSIIKSDVHSQRLLLCIVLIVIYIAIISLFSPEGAINYLHRIRSILIASLILVLIIHFYKKNTNRKAHKLIFSLLLMMFVFQTIIGLMQFISSDISTFFHFSPWKVSETFARYKGHKVVIGTFGHIPTYSQYLAIMTTFIIGVLNLNYIKAKKWLYLFVFLSITAMLLAGIRGPIIAFLLGVFTFYFFRSKSKFLLYSILFSVLVVIISGVVYASFSEELATSGGRFRNPLVRISGLFWLFSNSSGGMYFTRSMETMLNLWHAFSSSPIFGSAPGFITGLNFYAPTTDYFLFLLFAEFGIGGFMLILSPFLYLIRYIKKYHSKEKFYISISVFAALLTCTVADHGIGEFLLLVVFALINLFLLLLPNKRL